VYILFVLISNLCASLGKGEGPHDFLKIGFKEKKDHGPQLLAYSVFSCSLNKRRMDYSGCLLRY